MPPGLYLSKTLTQRDSIAMADAKARGYVVAAIDEELPGLFMSAQQLRWMADDAVNTTDMIFVAGAGNSAAVAERFPQAAGRIIQAANPRWDMLRPNLRGYYAAEAAELRRRYGHFILVNTNFGFTNAEKGNAELIIREQERLGKLDMKNPEHVTYVQSIITMEMENRQAIEELLKVLPGHFPNHRIVVRPHPSESADTWQKIVAGRRGIEVIREGAAVAWILASDVLIHTNCTTGVEALALDKPAICLMPSASTANDRYLSNRVNPVSRTVEEAIAQVTRIFANGNSVASGCYTPEMRAQFETAMSFDKEKLGADVILAAIARSLPTERLIVASSQESNWRPTWLYRWKLRDKSTRGRLMPNLDIADIMDRLDRFGRLLGLQAPATVTDIGSKVLLLSNGTPSWATRMRRAAGRYL
jgi:surface carbohydrate biosynthesis protein